MSTTTTSANILNLDKFVVEKRVQFNGKERRLRSMTVKQFIASRDLDKQIASADEFGKVELMTKQLVQFLDDTTEDELLDLEVAQLMMLLAFVRGSDEKSASAEGNSETPKS